MPENKKTVATRARETAKPMTKPQASKNPKTTDTAVKAGPATDAPPPSQTQRTSFEAAMKLFHARKFKEARELFEEAGLRLHGDSVVGIARAEVLTVRNLLEFPLGPSCAGVY